jgi:two-component system, sensor histidine kinase and response regulator
MPKDLRVMKNSILIVEKENEVREKIDNILGAQGFNVNYADCLEQSVKHIIKNTPDIIITGNTLSNLDKYDLLSYLRSERELPYIPFISLTKYQTHKEIKSGMRRGADDFVAIPIEEQDLLDAVNAGLKKRDIMKNYLDNIRESFALAIPHELRTPIMPITGLCDLILDDFDSLSKDEIIGYIKTIKENTLKLSKRIEKFIFLSSIQGEAENGFSLKELKNEKTEIDENYVKNILKNIPINYPENNFTVKVEKASLAISDFYLTGLVQELGENAFKFACAKTPVKVSGCFKDGFYQLSFRNHGRGLTSAQLKNINLFQQFRNVDEPKTGSGLGLFITKKIVEMFEGKLTVESRPGKCIKVTAFLKM